MEPLLGGTRLHRRNERDADVSGRAPRRAGSDGQSPNRRWKDVHRLCRAQDHLFPSPERASSSRCLARPVGFDSRADGTLTHGERSSVSRTPPARFSWACRGVSKGAALDGRKFHTGYGADTAFRLHPELCVHPHRQQEKRRAESLRGKWAAVPLQECIWQRSQAFETGIRFVSDAGLAVSAPCRCRG